MVKRSYIIGVELSDEFYTNKEMCRSIEMHRKGS